MFMNLTGTAFCQGAGRQPHVNLTVVQAAQAKAQAHAEALSQGAGARWMRLVKAGGWDM